MFIVASVFASACTWYVYTALKTGEAKIFSHSGLGTVAYADSPILFALALSLVFSLLLVSVWVSFQAFFRPAPKRSQSVSHR